MLHIFNLRNEKIRLWQRSGESYEHILMKALGYAMFVGDYPHLEIETRVGLRYKPDLIAFDGDKDFQFWGECGQNAIRKTHWILKHTNTAKFVLFKIGFNADSLIKQLRAEIPSKYRPAGRFLLVNFVSGIVNLTAVREIERVSQDWFEEFEI